MKLPILSCLLAFGIFASSNLRAEPIANTGQKHYVHKKAIHLLDNMIIVDTKDGLVSVPTLQVDSKGVFFTSSTPVKAKAYCSDHGFYDESHCLECKKKRNRR